MTDVEENAEVFEIGDFTVVTPLEFFVTQIEAALQDWELAGKKEIQNIPKGSLKNAVWECKSKVIKFHSCNELTIMYYYPVFGEPRSEVSKYPFGRTAYELTLPDTEFLIQCPITTMFGVTEFLVFSPQDPRRDNISTDDDIQYLRSAYRIAAQNCDCSIPMFVQFGDIMKQLYYGISVDNDTVTTFESCCLRRGQSQHLHLNGLLSLFKAHVKPPTIYGQGEIRTSVHFESMFPLESLPPLVVCNIDEAKVPFKLNSLIVGSDEVPIGSISLLSSWPNQCEDVIVESDQYSDLDPSTAFGWELFVDFDPKDGFMGKSLSALLDVAFNKEAVKVKEQLGIADSPATSAFRNVINAGASNIQFNRSAASGSNDEFSLLPLEERELAHWVNAVFRVVDCSSSSNQPEEISNVLDSSVVRSLSCGSNPLVYRLACAFYHLSINEIHPKDAHFQFWLGFVKELRAKYSRGESILPGLEVDRPDLTHCLLAQKLEMLQCCINAKRKRHEWYDNAKQFGNDEFFDASEDFNAIDLKGPENLSAFESTGRLGPFSDLKLVNHPEVPLYEFHTQIESPMTEDMIASHQEYLEGLSENDRVHAQLASLISDMQAFKAANPLGSFYDFIRWHSPKDWNEEKGCVSSRFSQPDNLWNKCWEESSPVPVFSQARLFNETAIAEDILSTFENASLSDVSKWMFPIVLSECLCQIGMSGASCLRLFDHKKLLAEVTSSLKSKSRDDFLRAVAEIRSAERSIMLFRAVEGLLSSGIDEVSTKNSKELIDFCALLVEEWRRQRPFLMYDITARGVPVAGAQHSPIGKTIKKLFLSPQSVVTKPFSRQYTIRWTAPRPSSGSRPVPHRLFATLQQDLFRVCGSFTEDALFT